MKEKNHNTTSRIIDALEIISTSIEGATLTEICERINAPKSTMSPILATLINKKILFLHKNKYKINIGAYNIGNAYINHFNFLKEIEIIIKNIVAICDETSHFSVLDGGDVLYIKKIDSTKSIRMHSTIGQKMPAYGTALGKALLLNHNLKDLNNLYPKGLEKLTKNTITDFNTLEEQLKVGKEKGYVYEIEESNYDIQCLAVPILKNNNIIAALSVAVPIFRYTQQKEDLILNLLFNGKEKIEKLIETINIDFEKLF